MKHGDKVVVVTVVVFKECDRDRGAETGEHCAWAAKVAVVADPGELLWNG